jgi:hypothetical protein
MRTEKHPCCGLFISHRRSCVLKLYNVRRLANNAVALGVSLFLVGILTIVASPTDLTIFTWRYLGPTGPIGAAISLVGLAFAVAGGHIGGK